MDWRSFDLVVVEAALDPHALIAGGILVAAAEDADTDADLGGGGGGENASSSSWTRYGEPCDVFSVKRTNCPDRMACYAGIGWDTATNATTAGCDCRAFYGHSGYNCDEYSWMSWFNLFFLGIISLGFMSYIFVFVLLDLCRLLRKNSCRLEKNASTSTLVFAFFASFFGTLWFLNFFVNVFAVDLDPTSSYDWWIGKRAVGLCAMFYVLSALNVSMMWMEVAEQAKSMKKGTGDLDKSKRIVRCAAAFFGIAVCILFAANMTTEASVLALLYLIATALTYSRFGKKLFTDLEGDSMKIDRPFSRRDSLKWRQFAHSDRSTSKTTMSAGVMIWKTAQRIAVTITVFVLGNVVYIVNNASHEFVRAGPVTVVGVFMICHSASWSLEAVLGFVRYGLRKKFRQRERRATTFLARRMIRRASTGGLGKKNRYGAGEGRARALVRRASTGAAHNNNKVYAADEGIHCCGEEKK